MHGFDASKRWVDRIRAEVKALDPKRYDPTLKVGYTGEVEAPLGPPRPRWPRSRPSNASGCGRTPRKSAPSCEGLGLLEEVFAELHKTARWR
jgi:hypothetical protein